MRSYHTKKVIDQIAKWAQKKEDKTVYHALHADYRFALSIPYSRTTCLTIFHMSTGYRIICVIYRSHFSFVLFIYARVSFRLIWFPTPHRRQLNKIEFAEVTSEIG